jgi:hypothetical protein
MTCANDPDKPGVTRVYRGRLALVRHSSSEDESDPKFLQALGSAFDEDCAESEDTPLAAQLARGCLKFGPNVRIRFVIGDDRKSADPMDPFGTGWAYATGTVEAEGCVVAGPRPGQWVVQERLVVGGQDLLKGLRALVGKFIHMEVEYFRACADAAAKDHTADDHAGGDDTQSVP